MPLCYTTGMDQEISDQELASYIASHKQELMQRYLRGSSGGEKMTPVDSDYNRSLHHALEMNSGEITEFWKTFKDAQNRKTFTQDQDNIFQILIGIRLQVPGK